MAAAPLLRFCLIWLLASSLPGRGHGFHSDVHHAGGDGQTGGFRLYSTGELHDVLCLDSAEDFVVRIGSDGHLRVRPLTSGNLTATWWLGRPLLGRKVRQLSLNGSVSERSLLAKIKAIRQLDVGLVKVEMERARNVDFIKNGVIRMQLSSGDLLHLGNQGNPGSLPNHLQGSEITDSTVTLQTDDVLLMMSADDERARVVSAVGSEETISRSAGLKVKLSGLHETHRLHPSLHVDISKDGSHKECYTSKWTVEVTLSGTLEVKAEHEFGLQSRHLVSARPSRLLHRVPLLLPPSSPLLHLVTSYNSTTWLEVYVTTSGPLHVRGDFNTSGYVILESSTCHGELPKSILNFTGWSVVPSPWSGHSHAHFSLQVSLFHEVRYESALHWEGISEPVKSLPTLVLSVKPTVDVRSSVTPDSVCLNSDLHLDGRLRQEDADLHRGGATLMRGRGLSGEAWSGQLFHQCSALCPEDTPISSSVSMTTACGVPSARVSRNDVRFQRLRVVQGDKLEFQGEETASAWCGSPGHPCPPCHPSSPQTPPCSDRVMAPNTADLLFRLSRLAHAEWPTSKVVVEEAWDEPDERHPLGRHGNESLYYEGRALLLTLSSGPDPSKLRRLAQLASCAGFPFAEVTSASVEVCTAASQSEKSSRHRRAVVSLAIYKENFQKFIRSIEAETLPASSSLTSMSVGQSYPPGKTLTEKLGPPLDSSATHEELCQYIFNDVEFPPEGQPNSGCRDPPRQCQSSCQVSESENPWNWCQHRAMTPRMALRLRRLAALVRQKSAEIEKKNFIRDPPAWLDELKESTQYAVEGPDMILPDESHRVKRKAANFSAFSYTEPWENKTVYYQWHSSVGNEQKRIIKDAMEVWEKYTCLNFVESTTQRYRTLIAYNYTTAWCQSHLGRITVRSPKLDSNEDNPHQWIHFNASCFSMKKEKRARGVAIHELGHTIGFQHEHQRPDSHKHITIRLDLQNDTSYKAKEDYETNTFGLPYDYLSIMHYPHPTVKALDPVFEGTNGQRIGPSFMDIKLANLLYKCSDHCPSEKKEGCNGTYEYLDENCECWCSPPPEYPYDVSNPRRNCTTVKAEKMDTGALDDPESGQALKVTLPPHSPLDGDQFSALAKQAGFDYVTRTSLASLQVYVKRQEGYLARLVPYQSNGFIAVLSPSSDYDLPASRARRATASSTPALEAEELPLVDGHDRSLPLSAHYRVGDFAHPDHRFFRLDPVLLDCLELAAEELGSPPRVEPGWAYRPASVNRVNLSSRHAEERENFQRGSAVFVKPPANRNDNEGLLKMATSLVGRCTPLLLRINRKLGLGCHGDKLYVDVRGMTSEDADQARYVELWDVDNAQLHQSLTQIVTQISKGGPVIAPASEKRACKVPELGEKLAYFSFSISLFCLDLSDACKTTLQRREEVAGEMAKGLNTVLGQVLSLSTVSQAVRDCLVSHCGGCLGAGEIWKRKLHACAKLVKLFSEHAPSPWGQTQDRGAFLNPHTAQSNLHALACQQGSLCLENTQLYVIALSALHARYKPDPSKSVEEMLYSGEDNPSPLLEVIQQEMAYSVQGRVKVYFEREGDLGVLKDTLKVLMVHNTRVTEVELHFPDQALQDRVLPRLQRHLEGWAIRACPRWSRFAVAPFSAHVIPPSRLKRSVELSRERNEARQALHSWEMDWLLRI